MTFNPLQSPIAKKLVWWFVAMSTFVALFSTTLQLYLDYRHDIKGIESYLSELDQTYLPSIAKNTWIMDDNQVMTLLEGITNRDDIIFASVSIDDQEQWSSGRRTGTDRFQTQLPILYSHRDRIEQIGSLTVIANLEGVYQRLARRIVIVLLANSIKTFIVAALALFVVQYFITRHLQAMASHVSRVTFNAPQPPLKLDRRSDSPDDELDAVSEAISSMQRRGWESYLAIHKTEQQLRLFLNSTEEAVLGVDSDGVILFVNTVCRSLLNAPDENTLVGLNLSALLSVQCINDSHTHGKGSLLTTIKEGKPFQCDDGFIKRPDSSGFHASIRAYPTFSHKDCSGSVLFFSDISSQRALHHQMQLLKEALDHSPISVLITDIGLKIVYVNPGFEKSTGLLYDEAVGKRVDTISDENAFIAAYKTAAEQALNGKQWQGRFRKKNKTGESRVVDVVTSPIYNRSGKITNVVAVSHDVTYEVELQHQLIYAQKHKALGRLSASIAHEFGNPLLGIKSLLKDLQSRPTLSPEDHDLLKIGISECDRMQSLIGDIYNFYGSENHSYAICDILKLLNNVLLFHKKTFLDYKIKVTVTHENDLPSVRCKEDQLSQVILNLILNAIDAMAESGGNLLLSLAKEEHCLSLTITDTGVGMDEKTMEQIFEPFFSTKPEVEGIGLGLPVSYGIITAHHGTITCKSEKGVGSTFKIVLPACETCLEEHAAGAILT